MTRNRWAVFGGTITGIFLVAALVWAATGNGPYYATPSWDQKLPASTRFVVLLDWASQAVLDRETGLVWEQAPAATITSWNGAKNTCINKPVGGRKGWRLPAVAELSSLIDPSVAFPGPTLAPGHPFTNVQTTKPYWSASTSTLIPSSAWSVDFREGVVPSSDRTLEFLVWCVRGPMQESAY
jgi:uncharacterized protein DUF1566